MGDDVIFSISDPALHEGMLEELMPRTNELVRPPVANVDQLLIVVAQTQPAPNYVLLDRILVTAERQCLPTIICINKFDLPADAADNVLNQAYRDMGYMVIECSAVSGQGLDVLKEALKGKTSALAGSSGVGKSTLINSMYPDFSLATGAISFKVQRGRHTTRHSELHHIDGETWIMDTPGFSTLSISDLEDAALRDFFIDFAVYQNECRFSTCLHMEEPGCAVKHALGKGLIHANRHRNYVHLLEEIRKNRRY